MSLTYDIEDNLEILKEAHKKIETLNESIEHSIEFLENYTDGFVIRKDVGEYYCPSCKNKLDTCWDEWYYCPCCGCRIRWGQAQQIEYGETISKNYALFKSLKNK